MNVCSDCRDLHSTLKKKKKLRMIMIMMMMVIVVMMGNYQEINFGHMQSFSRS